MDYRLVSTHLQQPVHVSGADELKKKVCSLFPTLSNLTYPSQVVNNDGETRVRKCQCLPSHKTVRVLQPHILNSLGQGEHLLTGRNLLTTPGNMYIITLFIPEAHLSRICSELFLEIIVPVVFPSLCSSPSRCFKAL